MQRNAKTPLEYDAQIAKGNEASALLNNPLLNNLLEQMESVATQKMIDSFKLDERELAWHKVRAVKEFRQELKTLTTTGTLAKQKKDQLKGE